jgi:hypothetical protein
MASPGRVDHSWSSGWRRKKISGHSQWTYRVCSQSNTGFSRGAGCCASISKTFVIAACPHFAMYDGTVTNQKGSREVEEKQLCDTVVGLRLPLPRPMKMESVRTSISQPTKGVSPVKRWADSLDITRVGLSYLELETSGNTTTTTPSRYLGPRHVPRSHILFVELQFNFGLGRE